MAERAGQKCVWGLEDCCYNFHCCEQWDAASWVLPCWLVFLSKNNLEGPSQPFSIISSSNRRFVASGKKGKEKLLGLECKTAGFFHKCLFFCKVCFPSNGSQDALQCWALLAARSVEKIARCGRSLPMGSLGGMGSDSWSSCVSLKGGRRRSSLRRL